jgi:3-hydroxybutyryl-CoA dehydratase
MKYCAAEPGPLETQHMRRRETLERISAMPQRYLDDLTPGEVFKSVPHTLGEKHFATFAAMTGDAHPLHYDPEYARAKGWDAPIAHGLMLLGLCALGAAPISEELTESMIAMLGNEARYKRPAFIGDTVTPQFTVVSIEPKGNDRGIVRLAITLHNQRNEVVLEGMHTLMLRRCGEKG